APGDVVSVRERAINCRDDGEGFASLVGGLGRSGARQGQRPLGGFRRGYPAGEGEGGRGGQELAARTARLSAMHGAVRPEGMGADRRRRGRFFELTTPAGLWLAISSRYGPSALSVPNLALQ